MEIKFDVYFKKNLGTLCKDNEVDLDGKEAYINLDLSLVDRLEANYSVGVTKYTDEVTIKDIDNKEILIPFKSDVVKKGLNEFEIVAYMKNGDIKVSQTYTYNIEEGIGEGKQSGSGESSDGHTHSNLNILNSITQTKVNEWNNKADATHSHNEYASKNHTHNASEIEGLENVDIDLSNYYTKSETYNKTEIDSKIANMGAGGSVDLSNYYTKSETDEAMNDKANKVHTHNEYLTELPTHTHSEYLKELPTHEHSEYLTELPSHEHEQYLTEHQDISHKADKSDIYTKTQTDNKISEEIAKAQLGGSGEVDLSAYATKTYVDDEISKIELKEGPQGPKGDKGDKGETGATGPQGPAGTVDTSEFYNKEEVDRKDKILDDKITTLSDEIEILSNKIPVNLQDVIDDLIGRVEILENNKPPTHIAVSSVELNKQSISCVVGDVVTLTATVLPSDATNKNITWSSSNDSVVKIDNGVVTAISKGTSVITVTTEDGGFTVSCNVVVDVAIDGFDIRYLKAEIPSAPITFPNELHPNPAEPDLVHPCVIYVKNGWNGYKYWMAINPYTNTQSSTENPCILCSNDGEEWIMPSGVETPIFGKPSSGHNSDPYIFIDKDGETMQYINRWADGTSTLEIFSSKNGVDWTEKEVMLPKSEEYDYLSPSVCIYNNKYYLFGINNIGGATNVITVLESENLTSGWVKVNEISVDRFESIWHSEIKCIDGEFIGLLQTGSAQGGDLVICKFKTPFDTSVESSSGAFVCGTGVNDEWNNLYYKSSFVKTDRDVKLYLNGKSRSNLDSFAQWRVGLAECIVEKEVLGVTNKYDAQTTYSTDDFILNNPVSSGSYVSEYKTIYAPFTENGLLEFEFEEGKNIEIIFKMLNTTDYWALEKEGNRLVVYRKRSGSIVSSRTIPFSLNSSSNLKIEFIKNIYKLYIDDRFCLELDEELYPGQEYYIKRNVGFHSGELVAPIKTLKAYYYESDKMSLDNAMKYVEQLKTENSNNPNNFLLIDDYTVKSNGVLVTDMNGTEYFTKDTMPSVSNKKLVCNVNNSALINISDCNKYEVACVLTDSYNKHQVYLCRTDNIEVSFGIEGEFRGYKFGKNIGGTVTAREYNILPYKFENGVDKVIKAVVDFTISNIDLYIDNQWVSKLDISDVKVDSFQAGVGGDLANCGFKFISIKKLD